jgi:hypothetical protein
MPDDVRRYCKNLIDMVGRDGGHIMDSPQVSTMRDPETQRPCFTREYLPTEDGDRSSFALLTASCAVRRTYSTPPHLKTVRLASETSASPSSVLLAAIYQTKRAKDPYSNGSRSRKRFKIILSHLIRKFKSEQGTPFSMRPETRVFI